MDASSRTSGARLNFKIQFRRKPEHKGEVVCVGGRGRVAGRQIIAEAIGLRPMGSTFGQMRLDVYKEQTRASGYGGHVGDQQHSYRVRCRTFSARESRPGEKKRNQHKAHLGAFRHIDV